MGLTQDIVLTGLAAFTGVPTLVSSWRANRANAHLSPAFDRFTAVRRTALPLGVVLTTGAGIATGVTTTYMSDLVNMAPTPNNITMHTTKSDLMALSNAYDPQRQPAKAVDDGHEVDPSQAYLASGERKQYYSYTDRRDVSSVMLVNFKHSIPVKQFVILGKKSNSPVTLETSGDKIKIVRDLDPKGSIKPYYASTSCSWKNSDVVKDCPITNKEIHVFQGSIDYPNVVTNTPWNTNDDTTDPLVAKEHNVADLVDIKDAHTISVGGDTSTSN